MSISSTIIPILKTISIMGFLFFLLYVFYWFLKNSIPNFTLHLKYKIFKVKPKEEDVEWLVDAIEKDYTATEVEKILLTKGQPKKKVKEMIFLLGMILKLMKGGNSNNGEETFKRDDQKYLPKKE